MGILSYLFGTRAKNQPGVYSITNRRTGCVYIGATTRPMTERWQEHSDLLRRWKHHNKRLQADWHRYGHRAFKFAVLEVAPPHMVFERERAWQLLKYTPDGCYNPHPDAPLPRPEAYDPNAQPLMRYTSDELVLIYREMRRSGMKREGARAILKERGIPLNNNLWAAAKPEAITIREGGQERIVWRDEWQP